MRIDSDRKIAGIPAMAARQLMRRMGDGQPPVPTQFRHSGVKIGARATPAFRPHWERPFFRLRIFAGSSQMNFRLNEGNLRLRLTAIQT
jgi:hypothetical protein